MRPTASVILENGALGRVAPSTDGISAIIVSGIAVSGQFALGDVLGPFTSPQDAIDKGITALYDTTNTCLAYKHIADFYEDAGLGTELYVMVVAKTVTMTDLADKALLYAKKMLVAGAGKIKMLAISRVPDGAYVPTYSEGFEADLWTAVAKAKALIAEEFALFRPVSIVFEARDFQGSASASKDLRAVAGLQANRVGIMMGADNTISTTVAHAAKYAAVGTALGKLAGIPVQRNMGRVKDGDLGILSAGFSNGAAYSTLTETNLDSLHDHGYMFFLQHAGKAGFFFNDDPVAAPITDDYSSFSRGRTMDKAARITRAVYLEELNDDVELDAVTGKLAISTIKHYQGEVEKQINLQMTAKGEIVKATAFVDPDQNVLSTDKINTTLKILPKAISKEIVATLSFENPSA